MRKRGFTMVELLVVITIIAVLAGLVMAISGGVRKRSYVAVSTSNLKQIHAALMLYEADYGAFPWPNPYQHGFPKYLGGTMLEPPLAPPLATRRIPLEYGYRIHAERSVPIYTNLERDCFDRRGPEMPFAHDPNFYVPRWAYANREAFVLFVRRDGSVARRNGSPGTIDTEIQRNPERFPCPGAFTWANY